MSRGVASSERAGGNLFFVVLDEEEALYATDEYI
jgi:hypothetical protein